MGKPGGFIRAPLAWPVFLLAVPFYILLWLVVTFIVRPLVGDKAMNFFAGRSGEFFGKDAMWNLGKELVVILGWALLILLVLMGLYWLTQQR